MVTNKSKIVLAILLVFLIAGVSYSLTTDDSKSEVFTFMEGDLVKITPQVDDPDMDKIFIYYYSPLNDEGEWQTALNDAGTYHTKIVVSDGKNQTTRKITLIVKNKNQPPTIEERDIIVDETEKINLKNLVSDPDGDNLTLSFSEFFDESGVWIPSYEDAGEYVIEITVSDSEFEITKPIKIKVRDKNSPPVIVSSFSEEDLVDINEDTDFSFFAEAKDDGGTPTYGWFLGGKRISSESSFEYFFDFESSGKYKLTLLVSDGKTETSKSWTLEVKNVNRAPSIDAFSVVVEEGETVVLGLPEKDIDGDEVSYVFGDPFNESNTWETNSLDAGTYDVLVIASDGELTTEGTIEVVVLNVDRAPETSFEQETFVVNEGEDWSLDLNEYVSDPDDDIIQSKVESLPDGASLVDNVLKWQPSYDFIQREKNLFTDIFNRLKLDRKLPYFQQRKLVLDLSFCGEELCVDKTIGLTVKNTNQPPVLENIKEVVLTETEIVHLSPSASDSDGDHLTYTFSEPMDRNGKLRTHYSSAGTQIVTVTVSDGELTDSQDVTLIIKNKNRLPEMKIKEDYFKLNENQGLSFSVSAKDPDQDDLNLLVKNLPAGASFKDGVFSWTPSYDVVTERNGGFLNNLYAQFSFLNRRFNKEYEQFVLDFAASDGEFEVVHPVLVTVKNVDRAPQVINTSQQVTALVGEPVTFFADVVDPDGDNLEYEWSFNFWDARARGADRIQRTFNTPGTKTVKVEVCDGVRSVEQEWLVKVSPNPKLVAKKEVVEEKSVPVALELKEEEKEEVKTEPVKEAPKEVPKEVVVPKEEPKTVVLKCPDCPVQKKVTCPVSDCPSQKCPTSVKHKCPTFEHQKLNKDPVFEHSKLNKEVLKTPEPLPLPPAEDPFETYVLEW